MKLTHTIAITIAMHIYVQNILAQPTNHFLTNDEGWTAVQEGPGTAPASNWTSLTGNPAGCFKSSDQSSGTWYYNSSAIYNTDLSAYYGDNLHFDLKQNSNTFQTNEPDVMICKADGTRIVYNTSINPGTMWTSYIVPLSEVGWKYNSLGGAAVTYNDMITFLTNISVIKIRGDYSSITTETDWLDNVLIAPPMLLPIGLINFSCNTIAPTTTQLTWNTITESTCSYFQVEKSLNNGISFDSIATVYADAFSNELYTYTYQDNNFTNSSYYQLKSVDIDATVSYSEIIFNEYNAQAQYAIYPNPSSGIIHIDAHASDLNESEIIVYDIAQKVVFAQTQNTATNNVTLNLKNLIDGMYLVVITAMNQKQTYLIQILK